MNLDRLFSPFSIGSLSLPCRIVMPPMATNFATKEGLVTEQQMAYYLARARGGVGYVTVEHTGILPQGKASPNMLLISSAEHEASLGRLIAAVHRAGNRIIVQINHAGRQTSAAITGQPIVGPSPIPCPTRGEAPRELSTAEIEDLVKAFAAAAGRVKAAGADGVEIHMAHGYLLCSFLSPFSNRRDDEYGGDVASRARFPLEVLAAVRGRVGADFPIICRMSGDEYVEGGLTIDQTRIIARLLARGGADAIHVSACNAASGFLNHPPYYVAEGVFVHLAEAVKAEVQVPVIAVGRIRSAEMAAQVIDQKKADLVSMGRALIADPELPNKVRQGLLEEIAPCISCNRCIQALRQGQVRCAVNPEVGNEARFRVSPAKGPKKVWVVGGGPGGLKAAEIAARRGHYVTLFEKNDFLGGRMRLAAIPPHKGVINQFLDYLERTIKALNVDIRLKAEVQAEQVSVERPAAIVAATGSRPSPPPCPGVETCGGLTVEQAIFWARAKR